MFKKILFLLNKRNVCAPSFLNEIWAFSRGSSHDPRLKGSPSTKAPRQFSLAIFSQRTRRNQFDAGRLPNFSVNPPPSLPSAVRPPASSAKSPRAVLPADGERSSPTLVPAFLGRVLRRCAVVQAAAAAVRRGP